MPTERTDQVELTSGTGRALLKHTGSRSWAAQLGYSRSLMFRRQVRVAQRHFVAAVPEQFAHGESGESGESAGSVQIRRRRIPTNPIQTAVSIRQLSPHIRQSLRQLRQRLSPDSPLSHSRKGMKEIGAITRPAVFAELMTTTDRRAMSRNRPRYHP